MKVIASTRPFRPLLNNADIVRVNGAYILHNELIEMLTMYDNKPLFIDIPRNRTKVNISNMEALTVIKILEKEQRNDCIVAFSKVETVDDFVCSNNYKCCVKIESLDGVINLSKFIKLIDIVCIDRVDLINERSIKEYLIYEAEIIRITKEHKKKIFIASDILPSLITKKEASLPEMIQLKYYQEKGIDGIILAEETAVGFYPYHAIDTVKSFKKMKGDKS